MSPDRSPVAALLLALCILLTGPAAAQEVPGDEAERIEARYMGLRAQLSDLQDPRDLHSRLGVDLSPSPGGPQAKVELFDLRLALAQMALVVGTNDQLTVLRAQPQGRLVAISLREGSIDADRLLSEARRLDPAAVVEGAMAYPVLVQQGATLRIEDGAVLALDRGAGAFVVNLGRLELAAGGIVARGAVNASAHEFAPFVVTAGTGVLQAEAALFSGLGFGRTPSFSGLAVIVSGLYRPSEPSVLRASLLRDLNAVRFVMTKDSAISDNIFVDARSTALELRGTSGARLSGNLFVDGAGDAIRLSDGARATRLERTEIYRPALNGIRLRGASNGTLVRDTLVWQAGKSALSVSRSDCTSVEGLRAIASGQKGLALRQARASRITGSTIAGSGSSGLYVTQQPEGTVLDLEGNRFSANRVGIDTAAPARLVLSANDFSDQFPRFLDGDVQDGSAALMADLSGRQPLVLAAGGTDARFLPPPDCAASDEG
ncbi:right-handed parallel beta-helix repeat-containing protein [Yangia mangrovi]|uniref:Right-handed parallel beta-helix repeat-containing protein n=2 Tax=Alloyangia mangrovi TaxID=1779329 RepID=A0ABT2KRA0_9RHOB|nr:right-handed parallel beta-helix repeat-containing protein [Alloyangia mangrovi]MCT4372638.1 right-handed parallel beta-helix repeat-containing protein [Alloyangia mangrovi]